MQASDFIDVEEYRGFTLGFQDVSGGIIIQGYIRAGEYGIPLKARYGETIEGLRLIVDKIYEVTEHET